MAIRKLIILVMAITASIRAADSNHVEANTTSNPTAIAWEVLDKGLSDSNEGHRQQTVLAGGAIGPTTEAVKFVAGGLHDKSTLVRQTAATVLGELQVSESLQYLREALNDNPEVSFTAARALCTRGQPDGCDFLQEVLKGDRKDPKPGFGQKSLKYAKKKLTPAELALMGVREASGVLLGPASLGILVGEEAVKAQTTGADKVESGRAIAAVVMADHPDEYTRILLEWALQDPRAEVRAAAAKGLARCGNGESIPKLQSALVDDHMAVRSMAAAAIIALSSRAGLETGQR